MRPDTGGWDGPWLSIVIFIVSEMEIKRGLCAVSPTKIYRQSVMCCLQGVSHKIFQSMLSWTHSSEKRIYRISPRNIFFILMLTLCHDLSSELVNIVSMTGVMCFGLESRESEGNTIIFIRHINYQSGIRDRGPRPDLIGPVCYMRKYISQLDNALMPSFVLSSANDHDHQKIAAH